MLQLTQQLNARVMQEPGMPCALASRPHTVLLNCLKWQQAKAIEGAHSNEGHQLAARALV